MPGGACLRLLLSGLVLWLTDHGSRAQESPSSPRAVLWREGEDRYRPLTGVLRHAGSCQPNCTERRTLAVAPGVFYKVRVEAAQIDMHSRDEHVEVTVQGQKVMCNTVVALDTNCSLVECAEISIGEVANSSELQVVAQATRTRDICKCALDPHGSVDCYSELLSGLDPTLGMLVRLTFIPQVKAKWVKGLWSVCSQQNCITAGAQRKRLVQCRVFDPEDVGSGTGCAEPEPSALGPCKEAPECLPPPSCGECISLVRWNNDTAAHGLNWSAIAVGVGSQGGKMAYLGDQGRPLKLRLLPGLANFSCPGAIEALPKGIANSTYCVSLTDCEGSDYLTHRQARSFADGALGLEPKDATLDFRMQATYHLRVMARAGYVLVDPYGRRRNPSWKFPVFAALDGLPAQVWPSPAAHAELQKTSAVCSLRPRQIMPPMEACALPSGHCCSDEAQGVPGRCCIKQYSPANSCTRQQPSCSSSCALPGFALMTQPCEDAGCSAVDSRQECETAAAALGLQASGGPVSAQLVLAKQRPPFCFWEPATPDNGFPALWLNKGQTSTTASSSFPQLCRCGEERPSRSYSWWAGDWSSCSLSCGAQRRQRKVACLESFRGAAQSESPASASQTSSVSPGGSGSSRKTREVPAEHCREKRLPEPAASEPCFTASCWAAEANTRCAGKELLLESAAELAPNMRPSTNGSDLAVPAHCLVLNVTATVTTGKAAAAAAVSSLGVPDLTATVDACRLVCVSSVNCVGFTLYNNVHGNPSLAYCCFLRRATRWQPNFRHATCHLAQGVHTRNGCRCQVGWSMAEGGEVCGASGRRGCCTTPDSGARSWCPPTSPRCGTRDFCDPNGVATVSSSTCRTHPDLAGKSCASARGLSECNQIATVLGLPDTLPSLTLSMHMPSGCVWQTATSQLWLNQLVDAVNASDPTKKMVLSATQKFPELCSCAAAENFRWEVGDWTPCFRDIQAGCHGARLRTRKVFCVRGEAGEAASAVVADSLCNGAAKAKPPHSEQCSGCDKQAVAAMAEFRMLHKVAGLQAHKFAQICLTNLALAASLGSSDRISLGSVHCCEEPVLRAEIIVSDAGAGMDTAAEALERLMHITRSAQARSLVRWTDNFASFVQFLSIELLGSYSWAISDTWSPCSRSCGGDGVQRRDVWCAFSDWRSTEKVVSDMSCAAGSKPLQERSCASRSCNQCPPFVLGPQYAVGVGGNSKMPHGSVVYVTCAAGYATVDDATLVQSQCLDGHWTPLAVSCGRSCPAFKTATWKYEVQGTGQQHGSTRQLTCKNKNNLSSVEAPPSATVVCEDGAWSYPSLACTGDCQSPELSGAYDIHGSDGGSIAQQGAVWRISCAQGFNSSKGQADVRIECVEGTWLGLDNIPECKSDCPLYILPLGYEVEGGPESHAAVVRSVEDSPQAQPPGGAASGSAGAGTGATVGSRGGVVAPRERRMQVNVTGLAAGVPHKMSIGVRCIDGYGRMRGAVEKLQCNDGQWSSLSLVCQKDCRPFNASSFDTARFRVINDLSRPNSVVAPTDSNDANPGAPALADVPHGSKVIIGCIVPNVSEADPSSGMLERAARRGELSCENGRWTTPVLPCFNDCHTFFPGHQYSLLIPDFLKSHARRSVVPHGTQLLATCARGFSPPPPSPQKGSKQQDEKDILASGQRSQETLIVEAECVDGSWTSLDLQCLPDCPPLKAPEHLIVDDGGGLRAGSVLRLACASSREHAVLVRCGSGGSWELATATTEAASSNSQLLDLQNISLVCPLDSEDTQTTVRKHTFLSKLDDGERALFMMLMLGCFGSLCGLVCVWCLQPVTTSDSEEEGEEEEDEDVDGEADEEDTMNVPIHDAGDGRGGTLEGLRRFNLLTGEYTDERPSSDKGKAGARRRRDGRSRSGRRSGKKGKISRARSLLHSTTQRALGTARAALGMETSEQPASYCQVGGCGKAATHICFPCSDLCLCLVCADELMRQVKSGPGNVLDTGTMGNSEVTPCMAAAEQASCPVCGQQVLCVIDAQPAGAFRVYSPVNATLRTVAASAATLRRTAATAARNVASRHSALVQPTVMGRSDRAEAARRAAAAPPNHSHQPEGRA